MTTGFLIVTLLFVVVSVSMVLIILVQRPSGGGLAGAFGGAGGGSDTVFGGRVGDALTWATVVAFILYLGIAITLNKIESMNTAAAATGAVPAGIESTELPSPTGPTQVERIDPTAPPADLPPGVREFLAPDSPEATSDPE